VKRLLSKESKYFSVLIKVNLGLLIGLLGLVLVLPLPGLGRWVLLLTMATLAGINWALITHLKR
jgi:hypothetical protein